MHGNCGLAQRKGLSAGEVDGAVKRAEVGHCTAGPKRLHRARALAVVRGSVLGSAWITQDCGWQSDSRISANWLVLGTLAHQSGSGLRRRKGAVWWDRRAACAGHSAPQQPIHKENRLKPVRRLKACPTTRRDTFASGLWIRMGRRIRTGYGRRKEGLLAHSAVRAFQLLLPFLALLALGLADNERT